MVRPEGTEDDRQARLRRVAVITGTRAEFGLLRPVMHAIAAHPSLELCVIAAGSHLIPPATTFRAVKAEFQVADSVPMQVAGRRARIDDAEATGRGIARFARSFAAIQPDWVVVLGDRIEAFAAASAASIGGIAVAHLHGGDRAEGIADEAMRHAITKLAHLHLPATPTSAERIARMGERPEHIVTIGSPAIDGLDAIEPLDDSGFRELGSPRAVFLMHPIGRHDEEEELTVSLVLEGVAAALGEDAALLLAPNQDPGRAGIERALQVASETRAGWNRAEHLSRDRFIALLARLAGADAPGVLVGNSSAGLIEAAAVGVPVVDLGPRQSGRERSGRVVHQELPPRDRPIPEAVAEAVRSALAGPAITRDHPYGDGTAGPAAAAAIASADSVSTLRKHNTY
ncbi:MAG: UDP-N-acetylglucosamine 2-epimerase [Planctomycetota bacterium]